MSIEGPLPFQSLPLSAAEAIREAIISGKLKPGDRLVEQRLAGSLGIGQPTIREALKELEFQGFVRKVPHKGTYVTQLSKEDFRKILQVRLALESLAIDLAARSMEAEYAAELSEIVSDMESAAKSFDRLAFHRLDLAFHRKIWSITSNEYLEMALERVVFALFAFVLFQQQRSDFVAAAEQHRSILTGLLSGDFARARDAFRESTLAFWRNNHQVEL